MISHIISYAIYMLKIISENCEDSWWLYWRFFPTSLSFFAISTYDNFLVDRQQYIKVSYNWNREYSPVKHTPDMLKFLE